MKLTNEEKCTYCREYGNLPCDECKSNNRIKPVTMEKQLKETELRLGNYVDLYGEIDQIKSINENENGGYCKFKNNPYQYYLVHQNKALIKPIPITEDILLKLGFEKGFHRYGLENCGLKCHKSLKENYWIVSQGFGMQFTELTEIQYIHQLQNLFFSLCGEELSFKN